MHCKFKFKHCFSIRNIQCIYFRHPKSLYWNACNHTKLFNVCNDLFSCIFNAKNRKENARITDFEPIWIENNFLIIKNDVYTPIVGAFAEFCYIPLRFFLAKIACSWYICNSFIVWYFSIFLVFVVIFFFLFFRLLYLLRHKCARSRSNRLGLTLIQSQELFIV